MLNKLWFFLIAMFLIRLLLGSLFPLTADESYYWLWSKHLDFSYVDHPPLVALINFLITFGKENLFALRLGASLLIFLISIFLYFLVKTLINEKIAFFSVVLFQFIPHYLIIWLTMFVELPLALFWTASLLILLIIIKSKNVNWWYVLAVTLGLGYLSKYTMFLFWPCLAVFLFLSPDCRSWLRNKEIYLCFLISALFFFPVLYWNSHHHWISFTFHAGKATSDSLGAHFLPFLADQLVHFTPFLIFMLYPVFKYSLEKDDSTKFLFSFSAPVLILFLILALKVKIWAHWPSIGYLSALPLTILYLTDKHKSLRGFFSWVIGFTLTILAILLFVSPGVLFNQSAYKWNYQFAEKFPPEFKVFAQTNVSASLLEFYTKKTTYLATGFLMHGSPWGKNQYEFWSIPNLEKHERIIYFGEKTPFFLQKAQENFGYIIEIPNLRLNVIEDYIRNHYQFFLLGDYKGENSHP